MPSSKEERSQLNKLTFHLKKLEKDQTKSKANRRRGLKQIRAEINKIGLHKQYRVNETTSWFFGKTDKPFHKVTEKEKKKREASNY